MKKLLTALAALLIVTAVPIEAMGAFRGTFRDAPAEGGGGGGGVANPMTSNLDTGGFTIFDTPGNVTIDDDTEITGDLDLTVGDLNVLGGDVGLNGGNVIMGGGDLNTIKQLILNEQAACFGGGPGTGAICVKNTVPSTLFFVDDAATEFQLGIGGVHPGTSTDHGIPRFDGLTGDLQDSGWTIGDTNIMAAAGNLDMNGNGITDTTDSRVDIPVELAVTGEIVASDSIDMSSTPLKNVSEVRVDAGGNLALLDDSPLRLGGIVGLPDVTFEYDTAQTADALVLGLSTDSRLMILAEQADAGTNWGRATRINPTLRIQSSDQTTTSDAIEIYHNQTEAVIESPGPGNLSLRATGGGSVQLFNNAIASGTMGFFGALDGNGNDVNDWGEITFRTAKGVTSANQLGMFERATAPSAVAGHGILYVDDEAPNELIFRDDVGTDLNISNLDQGGFLFSFDANRIVFPASPAAPGARNAHSTLDFDSGTDESIVYEGVMPSHYRSGSITVSIFFTCNTATIGDVVWDVSWEAMTPDVLDLDADSFAAVQSVTDTCAGVAGRQSKADITFTRIQADSIDPNTPMRVKVTRDADNVSDDLVGDAELTRVLATQ
jgi:hypothetical protein